MMVVKGGNFVHHVERQGELPGRGKCLGHMSGGICLGDMSGGICPRGDVDDDNGDDDENGDVAIKQ